MDLPGLAACGRDMRQGHIRQGPLPRVACGSDPAASRKVPPFNECLLAVHEAVNDAVHKAAQTAAAARSALHALARSR